ncbi:Chemotaxis response regulator protein-glutamate methylesterase CheB [hydrothermal vent metagenome]|uniref:protein-glutamate methylesterase n=1 Tax=hydrothermal vent metagenome TaxID=652676 RepID=A0A3B0ZRX1_9ZZZZ
MDTPNTYAKRPVKDLSMTSSMLSQELSQIRIAVISNSVSQRKQLKEALGNVGLNVVINEPLTPAFVRKLDSINLDVILLDLDEHSDYDNILDSLLDNHSTPIIFNDISVLTLNEPQVLARWYGKLLKKISASVGQNSIAEKTYADHYNQSSSQKLSISSEVTRAEDALAQNVWVLGASLGGPDAVKEFFKYLPSGLPVAFILTQHLGANFIALLAEQLNQVTDYNVLTPLAGHVVRHKEVIVMPVNERLTINPIGAIELTPIKQEQQYSPSINMVLSDMLIRYGKKTGTIIFSGMGDDGLKGCEQLHKKGAMVWTQSSDSCVISSMPENIKEKGFVSFTGNPKKLAEKLYDYLRDD